MGRNQTKEKLQLLAFFLLEVAAVFCMHTYMSFLYRNMQSHI